MSYNGKAQLLYKVAPVFRRQRNRRHSWAPESTSGERVATLLIKWHFYMFYVATCVVCDNFAYTEFESDRKPCCHGDGIIGHCYRFRAAKTCEWSNCTCLTENIDWKPSIFSSGELGMVKGSGYFCSRDNMFIDQEASAILCTLQYIVTQR
jgi:hypothetical protein